MKQSGTLTSFKNTRKRVTLREARRKAAAKQQARRKAAAKQQVAAKQQARRKAACPNYRKCKGTGNIDRRWATHRKRTTCPVQAERLGEEEGVRINDPKRKKAAQKKKKGKKKTSPDIDAAALAKCDKELNNERRNASRHQKTLERTVNRYKKTLERNNNRHKKTVEQKRQCDTELKRERRKSRAEKHALRQEAQRWERRMEVELLFEREACADLNRVWEGRVAALEEKLTAAEASAAKADSPEKTSINSVQRQQSAIVDIVTRHEPAKVALVEGWLRKYKGKEAYLLAALCKQYKEPIPEGLELPGLRSAKAKKALTGGNKALRFRRRRLLTNAKAHILRREGDDTTPNKLIDLRRSFNVLAAGDKKRPKKIRRRGTDTYAKDSGSDLFGLIAPEDSGHMLYRKVHQAAKTKKRKCLEKCTNELLHANLKNNMTVPFFHRGTDLYVPAGSSINKNVDDMCARWTGQERRVCPKNKLWQIGKRKKAVEFAQKNGYLRRCVECGELPWFTLRDRVRVKKKRGAILKDEVTEVIAAQTAEGTQINVQSFYVHPGTFIQVRSLGDARYAWYRGDEVEWLGAKRRVNKLDTYWTEQELTVDPTYWRLGRRR